MLSYEEQSESRYDRLLADILTRRDAMVERASQQCGRQLTVEQWLEELKEKKQQPGS